MFKAKIFQSATFGMRRTTSYRIYKRQIRLLKM